MSMSITLLLLILCFFALLYDAYALVPDGVTLLSLLTHWTFVPPIINSNWNASDSNPCCSWVGVQCDHAHNVVSLNLTDHGIIGQLGPEIGQLYHLQTLVLLRNVFSGKVPSELSNCSLLEYLDLSENSFSGQIPYSFRKLQNLRYMSLSANLLTGQIPDSMFQIPQLEEVNLHRNLLSGPIPTSIGNLTELLSLDLHGNRLSGTIPSSLGKLQNLFYGLNLSANGLTGVIPLELGNLQQLQSLDLSLNNLTGSIDALHDLLSLTEINISYNFLFGPVPKTLMKFLNSSPSSFLGNPCLCVSCSPSHGLNCTKTSYLKPCVYKSTDHKDIGKFVILTVELGSSIFVSAMVVALACMYRKSKQEFNASDEQWFDASDGQWSMTSVIERGAGRLGFLLYKEEIKILAKKQTSSIHDMVMLATENLNDRYIIGQGAHGIVYRAQLGELAFAVKKVAFGRNKAKRLHILWKEIEVLGKIKHRNLITYADYWVGNDYGIVLYEYFQNGSLHDILHEKNPPPPLTWNVRFNIAVGIAHGLKYLHYDCTPPIVHRDIKPMNILLDANMEPLIADFGTALHRNLAEHSDDHSQSRQKLSIYVAGTAGYIAPGN